MGTLRYIQAVLWSFIGLGRRADMAELQSHANPAALVAVGVIAAVLLVGVLMGLAMLAVHLVS